MILSLFKKNYSFNLVVILLYYIACGILVFNLSPIITIKENASEGLIELFTQFNLHSFIFFSFSIFVLTTIISLYVNTIFTTNALLPKNTLLVSGLFFLFSIGLSNYSISPALIIGILAISISLHLLLSIPSRQNPFDEVFYSSFLISLLAFVWSPLVLFIFLVWFSLIIYRVFTWREWLISFMGLIGPQLFYGTYLYAIDQFPVIYNIPYDLPQYFRLPDFNLSTPQIIWSSIIGLTFLYSFIRSLSATNEQNINYRKKMAVLNSYTFISLFIILFSGEYFLPSLLLLGISFSIYFSKYLTEMKNTFLAALLFFLINIGFILKIWLG